MAWDLWGPPDYIVEEQSSVGARSAWQCSDFADDVDADAVNEKCCVQVLKILIANADSEIDELGRDLVQLQCELAWMENEEWSQLFSRTLTERIERLDDMVRRLRNTDKNDAEEPVESLYDVLKALLSVPSPSKGIQLMNEMQDLKQSRCGTLQVLADCSDGKNLTRKSANVGATEITEGAAEFGSGLSDGNEQSVSMTSNKEEAMQHRTLSAVDIVASGSSLITVSKMADRSEKSKPAGSDLEQKLCDFVPAAAHKKNTKKAKISSSLKAQKLDPQDGGEISTKECSLEVTNNPKVELVEFLDDQMSDFNCSNSLQKEKAGKTVKFDSSTVQGMGLSKVSVTSNRTSISKDGKLQKSEARATGESVVQPLEHIMNCAHSSESIKVEDTTITESRLTDNFTTVCSASQCSAQINLALLKVKELRAIAKQRKIARFSKLRKKELLELLAAE